MNKTVLIGLVFILSLGVLFIFRNYLPVVGYSCPQKSGADCQPSVDEEDQPYCVPEYRSWIQKNCPEFGYLD